MPETVEVLPRDEHNEKLVSNCHPPDWENPEPAPRYNLVVIGAGTAGLVTAAGAAGLGAKVALVEKHLMGGDCLNVGCVPSKCLIRSSRAVADVKAAKQYGVRVAGEIDVDFPGVMERMRRLRSRISPHDSAARFRDLGVDVFFGHGGFSDPDTVEVGGKTLRFKKAVIATGSRAVLPPVKGLAEAGFLTNETVFSLTERPRRLALFGAGPVGCELAQAFQRLGSEVTLIQRASQILPREDKDVSQILADAFARDGIEVLLKSMVTRVLTSDGDKLVHVESGGEKKVIAVEEILVGAGRAPNVEDLNLEGVGVEYDKKSGVAVDDRLRTTNHRIYAAGDICMKHKFTHAADAAARIVLQNALFFGGKKLSALTIPWCTYTDPEIAHVGLSSKEAEEQGVPVMTFTRDFSDVDRAIADGEEEGCVKVLVGKKKGKILGATVVARHAGEMIGEVTLAMVAGVGLGNIANIIHPYPTQAEAIKQAGDAYNRTRLTPFLKKALKRFMAWRR